MSTVDPDCCGAHKDVLRSFQEFCRLRCSVKQPANYHDLMQPHSRRVLIETILNLSFSGPRVLLKQLLLLGVEVLSQ